MSVGNETMQLHIFLSLCEQNNRYTGTNQWQFERRDVIGHFITILIGYLYGDLWTKGLLVEFILFAVTINIFC